MDNKEFVWRVRHGAWMNDPLYTAYISSNGKKISAQLAIRRVIERLKTEGEKEQGKGRTERLKSDFEKRQGHPKEADEYMAKANEYFKNAQLKFERAKELNNISRDPEYSDNRNYLRVELVPKEPPKPAEAPKVDKQPEQLEFKFGDIKNPLKIESAFRKAIEESANISGDVLGGSGGSVWSGDFYAKGDSRVPKSIFGGIFMRSGFRKTKKSKRKHRKNKK